MTRLGDVCAIRYGKDHKKLSDGSIPTYGSGGIMRYVDTAICEQPSVLIPRKGTLGNLFYTDEPFWTVDTLFWTDIDQTKIVPKYLYYQLKQKDLASYNVGTAVPSLTVEVLNEIDLDVPSIDKQRRIVEVLNSFDSKIALNNQLNELEQIIICQRVGTMFLTVIGRTPYGNHHLAGRMHWSNVIRVRAIHAVHSQQSQIPAYESVPKVSHSPCRTALTLGGIAPLLSWLAVSQFTAQSFAMLVVFCQVVLCGVSSELS